MKVVFDTNILVSALIFPGGRADTALRRIVEEQDQLVISKPILEELLRVLGGKFSRDHEERKTRGTGRAPLETCAGKWILDLEASFDYLPVL